MKFAVLGLACLAAAASASAAVAAGNAAIEAPIHQFIDDFDKGDATGAAATHLPSVSIIDEVPPHLWVGPKAFATWAADLAKDDMAHGISEEAVVLGAVKREVVSGKTAYLVFAATYNFKQNGMAMHEPAQMTFAMRKTADGWKIAGWTWTGPNPTPVK
ncbi:MAG TPA: nuclear transport factor 2 family protein [Phenylobacterium sp.]|uniref:nuclear transport factor 2 family protein n=1 Tax=Phenylobacterium sp. TaxID=1871053 RepID=UPI002C8CE92C|nr:nuclear transport factor 2 family protein [Phenylobacterium sp.]HXA39070.1 nuclear transport factor 2 family protein [Phenylobacterium sp.]